MLCCNEKLIVLTEFRLQVSPTQKEKADVRADEGDPREEFRGTLVNPEDRL